MNAFATKHAATVDRRLSLASVAGIYAPLILILIAAIVVF